ncbi:DUF4178 domain-containing protein [Marinicrinis sediminis]|uniref:DUF4178 domain-containing protein n=1 Tax=Marinicrinis sediminis TaxID=1652465 RepID=A0ABW5RFL9_9BACL
MGWLDWLRGSKKSSRSEGARSAPRHALNLQVQDIVTYDLEDYQVAGKLVYEDSGYTWTSYNLKGDRGFIWLAAELDDELEVGIYERVRADIPRPEKKLILDDVTYYLEEHGWAMIREAQGQAGARPGQQVEYWDYTSEFGDLYLSIEKWGGDLEISKGYEIDAYELKFLAGS